ncbi:hypothetical protein DPMN_137473 [Dreissena polymorpha]|uniref:Uncharacterized protein n=1 Tax=Dreissena polymorpha TaxID=45954 RepID=A0A9D4G1W1_DREPO|nr:hypothetical protein DPMN_137473 [Dreissena polymorpha]
MEKENIEPKEITSICNVLEQYVEDIIGFRRGTIPLVAYIDNKSVIHVVALSSTKLVDDKRLRVDIDPIQESMEKNDVSDIK